MPRRPLDILNGTVVAVLLLLAIGCRAAGRLNAAPRLPLQYVEMLVAVLAISFIASRDRAALPRPVRWALFLVVEFYPMVFVTMVYDSLGFLIPALNPVEKDPWLRSADIAIFGVDPSAWMQRLVNPVLSDLLYICYATFFLFPIVVGIPIWLRSTALGRRFMFLATFAFYVSYAGYVVVPAEGPRASPDARQWVSVQVTPISRTIARTLDGMERNRVDAFPSGHVLVTAVCLMVAARLERRVFWVILPVGILLMVATIYCRYHYVVDVLASLVLAPVVPPVARWIYDGVERYWGGRRRSAKGKLLSGSCRVGEG